MSDTNHHQELSQGAIADRLGKVEEESKLVFNDRKEPLVVTDTDTTTSGISKEVSGIEVRGPQGAKYVLSKEGDWYINSRGLYRRSLDRVRIIDE